jgi:hypothetical protein
MTHLLIWLTGISLVELVIWLPGPWIARKLNACFVIISLPVISGLLFGMHFQIWAGIILVLSIYRVINLLRIVEDRLQADYLFRATLQTSWTLVGAQLVVFAAMELSRRLGFDTSAWLYALAIGQLAFALVLFISTWRHLRTTRPAAPAKTYTDRDLPTLSVAIPARNETDDLEACLESLISSDYPKLEILVLDDCSQNKRTPEIIRGYAQTGVRFIAGKEPPKHWLAKNYAYQQLADEANGELLLFCGVDTRFRPGSLGAMVKTLLSKKRQMMSVIPRNELPKTWGLEALMVQPVRYAWELALPRRLFKRPPVLSTCWLITKRALQAAGSFKAISNSISIESYFAKYIIHHNYGYTFAQSNAAMSLESAKNLSEQRATAIRVRYPQLHRKPELVGLLSLTELALLIMPFGLLIAGFAARSWPLCVLGFINSVLLVSLYSRIVSLTYRQFLLRGLWLLPFAVIYDVCLLNYSMWRYEFREVLWKGRNVCIPVMRVIPQLPKI